MASGQRNQLIVPAGQKDVGGDDKSLGALLHDGRERLVDLARGAGANDDELPPHRACRCARVACLLFGFRVDAECPEATVD